jgi:DNA invertase Pin-like site-specific DNA recombinase
MVYVRQSTHQQLVRHQESTRLQYGLVDRASALGWPRDRIVVIDDDLGCSGASAEGRPGFQRLVAEVGLDHVGIIIGFEMSRLARSCRDWHQLLEVCALFGTLIADPDGTYDPASYNDRLLLGLKGTMSEAELHILKRRMLEGKLAKARRGELGTNLPIGYVRRPSGEIVQDPDEGVREVVAMVFAQFDKRGTVNGVLRHFVDQGIQMPVREYTGPRKGDLTWRRPNRPTLQNLLKNPIYAGAYVYGRRPTDPRRKKPGRPATGRTVAHPGEWQVHIPDRLPAYISWEQFEANQRRLAENAATGLGHPRNGPSLLSGLLACGRCGRRMMVQYGSGQGRYTCNQEMVMYGGLICQSLALRPLDQAIEALVLEAIKPAALELSLRAAADIEAERERNERVWAQRLERARFEVQRTHRQYDAVEPENRLVARSLERQLEEKLVALQELEEAHRRHLAKQPPVLSAAERAGIMALAADIPALWHSETTTALDRQTIVRHLIDRIDVTVLGNSERVSLTVNWAGGYRSVNEIIRPVASIRQLSFHADLVRHIQELRDAGLTYDAVAKQLNAEGWKPAKRRATFTGDMVKSFVSRRGLTSREGAGALRLGGKLGQGEWTLSGLAAELDMPAITLHRWVTKGWVSARKTAVYGDREIWTILADAGELSRLKAIRDAKGRGRRRAGYAASIPNEGKP